MCFAMLDTKRLLLLLRLFMRAPSVFFFFLSYSSIAVSWSRWVYIYQRSVVHAFESSRVVLRCGQWRETVRVIISFADSERKQKRTNQIQTCNSQWSRALMFAIVLLVT